VGTGDQQEIALHLPIGTHRTEAFLLQRQKEHGLLLHAQLADLVQEQDAAVG